uniref:Uncharacterized protein n=1 Tax=Oryza meridionalis TaxID=40149 RepID=A0A0E0C1G9_9ORYZ
MPAATGSDVKSQAISGQIQAYSYLMTLPHGIIIGLDVLMISNSATFLAPIGQAGLKWFYVIYGVHVHGWFIYLFTDFVTGGNVALSHYLTFRITPHGSRHLELAGT